MWDTSGSADFVYLCLMTVGSSFLIRRYGLPILISCIFLLPSIAVGQVRWTGSWETHYKPWPHIPEIKMVLHVAAPTMDMLYPAMLELSHGTFTGRYELLLVKKNQHQLGIGRNKYPLVEEPFGLGPWMMYLNGVFDHQSAEAGDTIVLKRVWLDNFGIFMKGLYDNEFYTNTKVYLRDFLYRTDIKMTKVSEEPWVHPHTQRIVHTDSIYYGVYDPIESTADWLSFFLQDEERYDRDTVTIVHNGLVLADRLPVEHAMALDSIRLDTGENYLAFFADNYGDMPPNTANFIIGTTDDNGQLYGFDFSNPSNAYATVMVANFRYHPPVRSAAGEKPSGPTTVSRTKGRRNLRIGAWKVQAEKLILEIHDEQLEDGDVISLEVNGALVADHVEVSREGKKLSVSLAPGRNRIVFIAENLGRIPPNTAALRVIAGEEERMFHLSTDFERNNVLEIYTQE